MTDERTNKERRIWERLASRYDANTAGLIDTAYRRTIDKAIEACDSECTVLEIGCGTGIVTLGVAPHCQAIWGYDLSPAMIRQAQDKLDRSGLENVTIEVGDGYRLPHKDATFDLVLIPNVLHFLADPGAQMAEAHRLLKPGGTLITVTDCFGEEMGFVTRLKVGLQTLLCSLGMIPYLRNWSRADVRALHEPERWELVKDGDLYDDPVNYYLKAKAR